MASFRVWLLVAAILILFLYQNYLFIFIDNATAYSDKQVLYSLTYYNYYFNNDRLADPASIPYPPLVHFLVSFCYKIFGLSMEVARYFVSLFSVIFLLSMFGIGKELGDDYSGLSVMALAASSPHVLNNSRLFFLDFPQTALTALAIWCLIKSRNFRKTDFSIYSVIALTLAFLTKWSTAFFVLIPIAGIALYISLSQNKARKIGLLIFSALFVMIAVQFLSWLHFARGQDRGGWFVSYLAVILAPSIVFGLFYRFIGNYLKRKNLPVSDEMKQSGFNNFIYCSLLFLILVMPWYFSSAPSVLKLLSYNSSALGESGISVKQNLAIIASMFNYAPIYIVIGIIYFFRKKDNFRMILLLSVNILFLCLLSFKITFPASRYILSLVIFMAALGGYWVYYTGRLKPYITGFILLTSLVSMVAWTGIPMNDAIYYKIPRLKPNPKMSESFITARLFCSDFPRCQPVSFRKIVELMCVTEDMARPVLIVYVNQDEPGMPFALESIAWSAMQEGKRIQAVPVHLNKNLTIVQCLDEIKNEDSRLVSGSSEIIIVYREGENINGILKEIQLFFPGKPIQKEIIPVYENWQVMVIQLYEDD